MRRSEIRSKFIETHFKQSPYFDWLLKNSKVERRIDMIDQLELENRFTYHKPEPHQAEIYTKLRAAAKEFANLVIELTPDSREQSLAITHLEETVFWANAAVARRLK